MDIVQSIVKRYNKIATRTTDGVATVGERYAWAVNKDVLGIANLSAADAQLADDTNKSIPFTISTYNEDRDGDIVVPTGCVLDNYKRNPIVFFGHQSWEVPIGVSRNTKGQLTVYPESNRIRAVCYFDAPDPDSMFIYGKVKRGILSGASIAFVPIDASKRHDNHYYKANPREDKEDNSGWVFKKFDLTEWSVVGVPANAGAIRDSIDQEKSFITPKLVKALSPFAAKAKGRSFSGGGLCLCPPCPTVKSVTKSCGCKDCSEGKACPCDTAKSNDVAGEKTKGNKLSKAEWYSLLDEILLHTVKKPHTAFPRCNFEVLYNYGDAPHQAAVAAVTTSKPKFNPADWDPPLDWHKDEVETETKYVPRGPSHRGGTEKDDLPIPSSSYQQRGSKGMNTNSGTAGGYLVPNEDKAVKLSGNVEPGDSIYHNGKWKKVKRVNNVPSQNGSKVEIVFNDGTFARLQAASKLESKGIYLYKRGANNKGSVGMATKSRRRKSNDEFTQAKRRKRKSEEVEMDLEGQEEFDLDGELEAGFDDGQEKVDEPELPQEGSELDDVIHEDEESDNLETKGFEEEEPEYKAEDAPYGAQVVAHSLQHHEALKDYLEQSLKKMDDCAAKEHLMQHKEEIEEHIASLDGRAKESYPDHDMKAIASASENQGQGGGIRGMAGYVEHQDEVEEMDDDVSEEKDDEVEMDFDGGEEMELDGQEEMDLDEQEEIDLDNEVKGDSTDEILERYRKPKSYRRKALEQVNMSKLLALTEQATNAATACINAAGALAQRDEAFRWVEKKIHQELNKLWGANLYNKSGHELLHSIDDCVMASIAIKNICLGHKELQGVGSKMNAAYNKLADYYDQVKHSLRSTKSAKRGKRGIVYKWNAKKGVWDAVRNTAGGVGRAVAGAGRTIRSMLTPENVKTALIGAGFATGTYLLASTNPGRFVLKIVGAAAVGSAMADLYKQLDAKGMKVESATKQGDVVSISIVPLTGPSKHVGYRIQKRKYGMKKYRIQQWNPKKGVWDTISGAASRAGSSIAGAGRSVGSGIANAGRTVNAGFKVLASLTSFKQLAVNVLTGVGLSAAALVAANLIPGKGGMFKVAKNMLTNAAIGGIVSNLTVNGFVAYHKIVGNDVVFMVEPKAGLKSAKRVRKSIVKQEEDFAKNTSEYLAELAESDDIPKRHKAALKYHAAELASGEEGKEEEVEMDLDNQEQMDMEGAEEFGFEGQEEMDLDGQEEMDLEGQEEMDFDSGEEMDLDGQEEMDLGNEEEMDLDEQEEMDLEGEEEMDLDNEEEMGLEDEEEMDLDEQEEMDLDEQEEMDLDVAGMNGKARKGGKDKKKNAKTLIVPKELDERFDRVERSLFKLTGYNPGR